MIRNFKGLKFNRFEKIFEFFLLEIYLCLQVVADENAILDTVFQKFFIFYSSHKWTHRVLCKRKSTCHDDKCSMQNIEMFDKSV